MTLSLCSGEVSLIEVVVRERKECAESEELKGSGGGGWREDKGAFPLLVLHLLDSLLSDPHKTPRHVVQLL